MKSLAILFILTSQATIPATKTPTGFWMDEVTTPYYIFADAGVQVDIVSIAGGEAPIDPRSLTEDVTKDTESVKRFQLDDAAMEKIRNTPSVATINLSKYDAIYLPGGHGAMFDMPDNRKLAALISRAFQDGKIVSAVCHGAAGLVSATTSLEDPIVKGKRITGFTNNEEEAVGLTEQMPFLLETRLRELGGKFENKNNFEPYFVRDGQLITGQNPASSEGVAKLVLQRMKANAK